MNYEETMEYLAALARFGVKPGLRRTSALLDFAGQPQQRMKHVHIAGTNGKGSVAVMIDPCSGRRLQEGCIRLLICRGTREHPRVWAGDTPGELLRSSPHLRGGAPPSDDPSVGAPTELRWPLQPVQGSPVNKWRSP